MQLVRIWMSLTVQADSLERLTKILEGKRTDQIDKVALFRECESPRHEVESKDYWVCFEAEMKLQIWVSQFETFSNLMEGENGSVSQLNMGEGKTQVIIPMIVLDLLYGKKKRIPRVNLLQALYPESRSNYYRFLSITSFNIPIIELPFDRSVDLCLKNLQWIRKSLKRFIP